MAFAVAEVLLGLTPDDERHALGSMAPIADQHLTCTLSPEWYEHVALMLVSCRVKAGSSKGTRNNIPGQTSRKLDHARCNRNDGVEFSDQEPRGKRCFQRFVAQGRTGSITYPLGSLDEGLTEAGLIIISISNDVALSDDFVPVADNGPQQIRRPPIGEGRRQSRSEDEFPVNKCDGIKSRSVLGVVILFHG